MPSHLHERFLALVEDTITREIGGVAQRLQSYPRKTPSAKLATQLRKIYKGRSATIDLRALGDVPAIVTRNPDATFYHPSQPHLPCLAIEVSYSQPQTELRQLAKSYIIGSHCAIRCVVGFSLPYRSRNDGAKLLRHQSKCARVWVWRGTAEEDGTDAAIRCTNVIATDFRSADGAPCSGNVELCMSDLLPTNVVPNGNAGLQREASVKIPFAKLTSLLSAVEGKTRVCSSFTRDYDLRSRRVTGRITKLLAEQIKATPKAHALIFTSPPAKKRSRLKAALSKSMA